MLLFPSVVFLGGYKELGEGRGLGSMLKRQNNWELCRLVCYIAHVCVM